MGRENNHMRVLIGDYIVKQAGAISKHDLDKLRACNPGAVIIELGDDSDWNEMILWSVSSDSHKFWIAIYSRYPDNPPAIVSTGDDNLLLFFYGDRLAAINLSEAEVRFEHRADMIIYEVKKYNNTLVAVSELDVVQLQTNGDVLAHHSLDDVLESYEFKENSIICKTMSSCREYPLVA